VQSVQYATAIPSVSDIQKLCRNGLVKTYLPPNNFFSLSSNALKFRQSTERQLTVEDVRCATFHPHAHWRHCRPI